MGDRTIQGSTHNDVVHTFCPNSTKVYADAAEVRLGRDGITNRGGSKREKPLTHIS